MGVMTAGDATQDSQGPEITADVAVVGAGMVGLVFGCAIARAGLRVVLIDREAPDTVVAERFDGRASAIAHSSQRMLDAVGLWHSMAPRAQPILEIRVSDGAAPLFLHFDHVDLGDAPLGYMVENRDIRAALHAARGRLAGLTLIAPGSVIDVECGASHARLTLKDGRAVRAQLVVAADGVRSPTRAAAGIRTIGWRYQQMGIVCTVAHAEPHRGIAHERFLPAGPFAILPLTGNRSSLVWTERSDLAPAMIDLDDAAFLAEVQIRFGDFLGDISITGPRWSYPLSLQHALIYVGDRLALIGDAAHGLHPIAGQGLNMGLRDAAALAERLVDARRLGRDLGEARVLESYQRWRRFDNTVLLAVTDSLNRLFSNAIPPVRLARDLGLAAVNRSRPLKRFFMGHARGTTGTLPRLLRGEPL
jgi:2-octaprenyl-6-methoxyphenol hydroxylase